MMKRLGAVVLTVTAITGLAPGVRHTLGAQDGANLTVHEWGTFTSIAGQDGQAMEWRPLTGPSDLPCFVTMLNPNSIKILPQSGGIPGIKALVRMETPVLYFYSPSAMTVRVSVGFPQGLFSEWYPQATVGMAQRVNSRDWQWQIKWSNVQIAPGAKEVFPTEPGESHYYAARDTDAAPVTVASQPEKFLFYRGIATFAPPMTATIARDGNISILQKSGDPIDTFVLFERRRDRFGYRMASATGGELHMDRPALTGSLESLRNDLRDVLTKRGLYPREAAAMVETWRDSWFEEGTRLFYLLPQSIVDDVLPLDVDPKPANITRVFVGRMELVTPEIESEVADAIRVNDRATLQKYGRFLEPISQFVEGRLEATHDEAKIGESLGGLVDKQPSAVCRTAANSRTTQPIAPSIQ